MADIHVEPKKQTSNSWIWIVLALVIAAAVIYFLMNRNKNTEDNREPANTTGFLHQPAETFSIKDLLQPKEAALYTC
jgi:flagellar basal body-associated protein FliL